MHTTLQNNYGKFCHETVNYLCEICQLACTVGYYYTGKLAKNI